MKSTSSFLVSKLRNESLCGFIKRVKSFTIYVSLQFFIKRLFRPNRVQGFSSPWAIYRCVAANMKVIKTQSEPNLSYVPMEALGKTSSVTATIIVSELLWTVLKCCESHETGTEIITYSSSSTCFGLGILYPS